MTDTSNYWIGLSDSYSPDLPIIFLNGGLSLQEVYLDENFISFYDEEIADFLIFALYVGSEDYDISEIAAHAPQDSSAEIGRVTVLETDTSFIVEYRKVFYELFNLETDSIVFLDAQFTYQVHLDYKNDKIRYHFGEPLLGPEAEAQMQEFSILSGMLTAFEINEGEIQLPFIFADKDPARPDFITGEGEFEEIPPFQIENFPEKGTVYEFTFNVVTSAEEIQTIENTLVFPNPGSDQLTIKYPSLSFDYEIRNALGQLMQEGNASRTAKVSTAAWPAGTYFISVGQGEKSYSETWFKHH